MNKITLLILSICTFSCTQDSNQTTEPKIQEKPEVPELEKKQVVQEIKTPKSIIETDTLTFMDYFDDGDYNLLYAKKDKKTYGFINQKNEDRSLLRGDIVEIKWKKDIIYMAGDDETPVQAEWIVSAKKVEGGNVSKFRKSYDKQLKYTWSEESTYSDNYIDHLYLEVEYYIANTRNKLIKQCVADKTQLQFSIEQQNRKGKEYTVLGIATVFENRVNTMQWLYYEYNDKQNLYEYDLPNDKLIEFN